MILGDIILGGEQLKAVKYDSVFEETLIQTPTDYAVLIDIKKVERNEY